MYAVMGITGNVGGAVARLSSREAKKFVASCGTRRRPQSG
jgi:hypothetical protein